MSCMVEVIVVAAETEYGDKTTGNAVALHGFLLTEADKVVDKLAQIAVHGSVYSIWRGAWRKCSFNGDESMCGRVRWYAAEMLCDVLQLRRWCADGTRDTEVLEIMNASRC